MDIPPIQAGPPPITPASPVPSLRPTPQPPKSSNRGWIWALGIVSVLVVGVIVVFGMLVAAISPSGGAAAHGRTGASRLKEVVLEDNDSRDKIAVMTIDGVISGQQIDPEGRTLPELVKQQLDRAANDENVKAVILKVDSPGGEVLASDEIYRLFWDFAEKHPSKPVVVSMGSLAASGGYYVSAPAHWIVANELTITGSIGVIFRGYNYRGLMDKVGVRPTITKSGKLKDMLSGEKTPGEELPEEKIIMQGMIDESYGRFKTVVKDGRERAAKLNKGEGRALSGTWESVADGRIVSGKSALDAGLVDELGNFDVAVARAEKLAGIEGADLVSFEPPLDFVSMFRLFGQAQSQARGGNTVRVDLGLGTPSSLPQGRLYFLSPMHAP